MPADLTPVITASAHWLLTAYPPPRGALSRALAEAQARQAAALAAALRYPTALDGHLLDLLGPGGSGRLDELTGSAAHSDDAAWRTWVDETVVSWAACLLADPALAEAARSALAASGHPAAGSPLRLTDPGPRDTEATPLLRHPDLTEPVAGLHRTALLDTLHVRSAEPA
ncbi:hypothetical protein [Kitasatospora cineracea]|uniref:Uncharacterized protein n=1 Tax=Kitasatospora cineracea TaxID=88074 RepID=A0A3N4S9D6_9ACTN|nr:hypothetical protein [Kitasatospora cineracea]RPE37147.1 hypothetical protein EDD38_5544 [Kitasatospora cineracea]